MQLEIEYDQLKHQLSPSYKNASLSPRRHKNASVSPGINKLKEEY
jgi:hypothetical protein